MKKIFSWLTKAFALLLLLIVLGNAWIVLSTSGQVYKDIEDLPEKEVGVGRVVSVCLGNRNW